MDFEAVNYNGDIVPSASCSKSGGSFKFLSRLFFLQNMLARFVAQIIPPFFYHNLGKYFSLKKAFYLVDLEQLEGDYLEFGVFTGSSMSCAILCARYSRVGKREILRKFIGFDSFDGFGELSDSEKHPFYTKLNFETDEAMVKKRLEKLANKSECVQLVKGFFSQTCDNKTPHDYGVEKAAVIMVDNDTYSGAISCLKFCELAIQPGTIILFDDFYSYKGSEHLGICGAFNEWSQAVPFSFRKISDYGMGGVIFIVSAAEGE